jgi:hypothetical protein
VARVRRAAICVAGVWVLLFAGGCGDPRSKLEASDFPPRVAAAIPRLERAGYETGVVPAGINATPSLWVGSDPPVVIVIATLGERIPSDTAPVRDPSGDPVDVHLLIGCGRTSGEGSDGRTIKDVLSAAELCAF